MPCIRMPGALRAPCHLPQLAGPGGTRSLPVCAPPPSAQGPHQPGLTRRNGARGSAAPHLRAIDRPAAPAPARCAGAAARGPAGAPLALGHGAAGRAPLSPAAFMVSGAGRPRPSEACPPVLGRRLRRGCARVHVSHSSVPPVTPAWAGAAPPSSLHALCLCFHMIS